VFSDVVHIGDVLRLAFYVVLAVGAEREIHTYWSRLVRAAASDERRRLARELHDGLAQELAFLSRQTRLLARGAAPPGTDEQLISASDRALDEARRAISTLTARDDEPLAAAITSAAEDVAARVGTNARVEVDASVEVSTTTREAVLRIVREAVGNAGRHGRATTVTVELGADRVLRITDDGAGFDVAAPTPAGRFGLTSMRERAEGLGGMFTVTSTPGHGTTVQVVL
jgi:signal transduction histidine kinase